MPEDAHALSHEQIAASIHGAGHVRITEAGVQPSHFTEWVTDRVMSLPFTVAASAAGGSRLRLRTAANRIRVEFTPRRLTFTGETSSTPFIAVSDATEWALAGVAPESGTVLTAEDDGSFRQVVGPRGSVVLERPLFASGTAVDLHLPIDAAITLHAVEADEPIEPREDPTRRRWVHHGSSISQGGDLASPLHPWPVQAARILDVDLVNASLPGNCLLDPCVAEELAGLDADVVSLELGINVANWDSHIARTFVPAVHHVLDQFHRADPARPVIVISPLHCEMYEHHGGSLEIDENGRFHPVDPPRAEALDLTAIRGLLEKVVAARPAGSVILVDGRSLLGAGEQHLLTDGLHPDLRGATLIAQRFVAAVDDKDGTLNPF